MAKFRDKTKAASKSRLAKYRSHETWKDRHSRRLDVAHHTRKKLRGWCRKRGLELSISNEGHHWVVREEGDPPHIHLAQWWPSSAKLVIRCKFRSGIHCHDVYQVIEEISRELGKEKGS